MNENKSASAKQMWSNFIAVNPVYKDQEMPEHYYYCDNEKDANECAELVVKGIKQATAGALWSYEHDNEPLPQVGDMFIITDWDSVAKAIVKTIKVEQVKFKDVTAEFARIEGEGDKSLTYWKRVHEAFFTREMEPKGKQFTEEMVVVCEHFKTIWPLEK